MLKLFKAELKKIFLKPSIFVVTGLIILMLAFSTFAYKPSTRSNTSLSYDTYGTVQEYYNYFTTSDFSDAKESLYDLVDIDATNYVNSYLTENNIIEELQHDWQTVKSMFDEKGVDDYLTAYRNWQEYQTNDRKNDLKIKRQNLKSAIVNFKIEFFKLCGKQAKQFLITKTLFQKIENDFKKLTDVFDIAEDVDTGIDDVDGYIVNNLKSNDDYLFNEIKNDLQGLYEFKPSQSVINSLAVQVEIDGEIQLNENSPINIAKTRLDMIEGKIQDINTLKGSSTNTSDKQEIMNEINKYYLTANYAHLIVTRSILISALDNYKMMDITSFYAVGSKTYYEICEDLTRTKYLFDTATYRFEYADVFSVTQPSNIEVNAFDFSYYALRLCAFFITVYVVVLAAGTIAGEQSDGTLKLLAIRPFSRNKILSAKIWATFTIGVILLFVSSVASLVIGGVTYGFNLTNVLVVFNANFAFVLNPILLYIIALLTIIMEILFYALLSVFISTVFKSNVAAVSISTLIYFISLLLNTVAGIVPLLGLIPFVNVNFFKYFGSAFLPNSRNKIIADVLTPTVFAGSTFWSSLILYSVTIIVITIITHIIFKKRDIK